MRYLALAAVKPKSKDTPKSKSALANGVQTMSIQDVPKVKSKNIDVISEYKKVKRKNAANFVVIGEIYITSCPTACANLL